MATAADRTNGVKTGLQFASEFVLPGASNLLNGDYKSGAIHAVAGIVAGAIFGVPGVLAVAANSFTKATTGASLLEHLNITEGTRKS